LPRRRPRQSTLFPYTPLFRSHAVDRDAIVQAILGGTGVLAKNFLPPVVWGYTEDVTEYPYDPERARELLAEAGYPNGFEVEFWVDRKSTRLNSSHVKISYAVF